MKILGASENNKFMNKDNEKKHALNSSQVHILSHDVRHNWKFEIFYSRWSSKKSPFMDTNKSQWRQRKYVENLTKIWGMSDQDSGLVDINATCLYDSKEYVT